MNNSDNEVIFITYDGVIKSPVPFILKMLQTSDYEEGYSDMINYNRFKGLDDGQLLGLATRRITKNILEYLATQEFDYEASYQDLILRFPNIYEESKLLSMGNSIHITTQQSFLKHIYIYTEYYDKRVQDDISNTYNDLHNITYVSGDFKDVISKVPERITSYVLNDIEYINILLDMNKLSYTNVLLAKYGYNYKADKDDHTKVILKIDDIDNVCKENIFKLAMFSIDNSIKF